MSGLAEQQPPPLVLRSLPYLDEKWLRADLYGALQNTEDLSILWNNLVKDHELLAAATFNGSATTTINSAGNASFSINGGQHYCGVQKLTCSCCSGYCRPFASCNCPPCQQLDDEPHPPKRHSSSAHHHHQHQQQQHQHAGGVADGSSTTTTIGGGALSDSILDSWLWGPIPSKSDIDFITVQLL